jgi:glycosyltransferase involved in cell wall biosynthesis
METGKRVLWFSTMQLPTPTHKAQTRVRWQEGLRNALENYHPEIELGIVVFSSEPHEPVVSGNATYFTFPRIQPQGRFNRARKLWQHLSYTAEELDYCIELVQSFSPDLVHMHGSENFYSLISAKLTVPSVLSIQGIVNGCFPYLFSDLNYKDILKLIATKDFLRGEGLIHKWLSWNKYYLSEQQILRSCKNFIGRTEWDKAMVLAFNPQARYFHCNEILADTFYDLNWNPAELGERIIYSTSANAFFKGGLILVQAMAIINQRGYQNLKLHLAGTDADSELGKKINELIVREHLEGKVRLLGRLSYQQIIEEMKHASVFVLPSHIDNSPNSLCEAMLIGMPCIATQVGGIPTLVRDGVDGLLYHDRDPYILAEKIIKLIDDNELSFRLGAQARKTALQRHDRQKIADRTVEIYRSILSG